MRNYRTNKINCNYFWNIKTILICLLFTVFITACSKDESDNNLVTKLVPKSGIWIYQNGSNSVQFNVSDDGSKITKTGSTLANETSVIVKILHNNGCGGGTVLTTNYFYSDIDIVDMKFSFNENNRELSGTFSSVQECSGKGSYKVDCYYPYSGSYTVNFIFNAVPYTTSDSTKKALIIPFFGNQIIHTEYDEISGKALMTISK